MAFLTEDFKSWTLFWLTSGKNGVKLRVAF